jgi:hypothetical protein
MLEPMPLALERATAPEWRRTGPDAAVYLPSGHEDGYNDHVLVIETPDDALLAMWTQGSREGADDLRVVSARSADGGATWTAPQAVADDGGTPGHVAWAGFPVAGGSGRIYGFFNQNVGPRDGGHYFTGVLRCAVSDDDGRRWRIAAWQQPYRRTRFDHPDPSVPAKCVVWQRPIRDAHGRVVVGFTRFSSTSVYPVPARGFHYDSSSELMRIEGVDEGLEPEELRIAWLPDGEPLRVACPVEPERSRGYSLCEEPAVVRLPDARLFLIMRTLTGCIWYAISDDDGRRWCAPEPLRFRDGGDLVLHPKAPCPLFALEDGRYLLVFHDHDGFGGGGRGPGDMDARRPVSVAVGAFRPSARQPVWFSRAKMLCDTDGVAAGSEGRPWLPMYASLTERRGERMLWYPDRKHFVLGRRIDDAWLAGLTAPS